MESSTAEISLPVASKPSMATESSAGPKAGRKPNAFKAVFGGRCPVCREGAVFAHPWHSTKFTENHKHCPSCGTDFEPEPGFLYGALYVSYSLNVATFTAVSLFIYVLFNPESPLWYVFSVTGVTILGLPFIWRLSRMLWIYWFGPWRYDAGAAERFGRGG